MGKNKNSQLLNNIKFLASQNADPFDSVASSMSSNAEKRLSKRRLVEDTDENKDTLKRLEEKLSRFGLDDNDFDSLIDTIDEYDEDSDLRNALIQEGRKYARDYAASSESSEIVKAFAPQETRLNTMLKEFDKEEIEINKDIDQMRFSRSRSGKSLADLITARASIAKTKLDIIKEINNIKKTQFDIRAKYDKAGSNDNDPMSQSNALLQGIFGMDQGAMFGSHGREEASGAVDYDDDDESFYDDSSVTEVEPGNVDNTIAEAAVKSYDLDEESDGAKYEGAGVQMVLTEDMEGNMTLHAEDRDGNRIDDYPLPKDFEDLTFDKNIRAGTAVDQLQRPYKYVYTGSDY